MTSERRANDNGDKSPGYELGDLEIVPTRSSSATYSAVKTGSSQVRPPVAPNEADKTRPVRGTPRNLTLADGDMGPALELDLAATPAAAQRTALPEARGQAQARGASQANAKNAPPARPAAASAALALPDFGKESALDEFDHGGLAQLPQLEVEQIERPSAERVIKREPAEEARNDPHEETDAIRALGNFDDPPANLIASVRYAFHVTGRVIALRKERAGALAQQRARASEHQAALVALGQALLAKATDKRMEPLRSKVAHVQDERAKLERADQGVERTREGNQRALGLLRAEAEHLKEELAPYEAAENEALAGQRKADEEQRRAQAMQKRVEIERRALEAAAAVDEARLAALDAQLAQRREAVQALAAPLAQANEALGKARRDLALKRGALDANEEKQKRLEAESRARELEAEGQKQAAHGAFEAALCELAEGARKQKLALLAGDLAGRADASEAALGAASVSVTRFDRALTLYDRGAVIRGYALLVGIVALACVAFVLR